jgi:uncharacterized protein
MPDVTDSPDLHALRQASADKLARLEAAIASLGGALVAFSGGVDSTFVLAAARRVLGDRAVALTAHSASVPEAERAEARELAKRLGARHLEVVSRETEDPRYAANPVNRCYFCKTELYGLCREAADRERLPVILDGFNADDTRDHRPGHQAARERGVRSPLAEVGLTKAEIRAWSRAWELPTWDKPQMACLASRFPYGTAVTPERLAQVERAESGLRALGLRSFRVRYHGDIGRVEVAQDELPTAFAGREAIVVALRAAGFQFATLDLEPFRSGRLNESAGAHLPVI